ncbi:Quinoprotein glucose dehydrogenase B precursor [Microbacterium oxydans]|uniref:Quinoprotein glucose dehydrogenase B n=1 Tax=Microbacterium oxydans TaxID=82380 RepID=A0A0F0L2Z3_9MICO|nr:PQQ-dependent sugar dehydrogenase [Microbacterium oxydans]KJL27513.1 Quinoprotein glucose dehydrogenase B precursor [Microbacterium oxydans]
MKTLSSRGKATALAAFATAVLLSGCTPAPEMEQATTPAPVSSTPETPSAQGVPQGDPTVLASGLVTPWSVAFAGETALISERDTGNILELTGDTTRVVGTIDDIVQQGESGLLGIAVDEQQRLYAYSTGPDGNRIQRFALDGEPGSLTLGVPETVVDGIPAASYHDGGRIAFGPDGMLYATTGDAGGRENAQDLDNLAGKILRMTPDGAAPDDNPFPDSLVYSYGHRNPQGIAWADDGTLFATEFGQNTWDELNIITPGSNYGWPVVEGIGENLDYVDPVQQWTPEEASPSGIAVVGGTVFIANLRGQTLRAVPVADPSTSTDYFSDTYGRLRHVAEAPDGTLWFLTSNTDGYGSGPRDGDDRILSIPFTN